MNGLAIFSHSLRQVTGNFGMAIKLSGWLVLIYAAAFGTLYLATPNLLSATLIQDPYGVQGAAATAGSDSVFFLLLFVLAAVFMFWGISVVAIAWHRYILLEEVPRGIIPYRKEFPVGRYFWYGVGVSLLAVLAVAIISAILGRAIGPYFLQVLQAPSGGASIGAFLLGLFVGTIALMLYLRMALVLPAVALEGQLNIRQAWTTTSGHAAAIVVVALILALINVVVPPMINLVTAALPLMNSALNGLYQWFYFMLNISVLSTLYGHIVQNREVY